MNRLLLTPALALAAALPARAQTPTLLPGWPVQIDGATVNGGLLVDVDGDPELELVQASGFAGGAGFLHVLNPDGTYAPGWPQTITDGSFAAPAFGDIDGDGDGEIVLTSFFFGIGGDLWAFHHDGTLVAGFPVDNGGTLKGCALGDLDGDGELEIVCAFNVGGLARVHAIDGDGTTLPGWPQTLDDVTGAAPSIGDVDGDGVPEIFSPSYASIHGFRPDGTSLPGFPFDPGNQFVNYNTISLADLDADGDRELVFATSASTVDSPGRVWVLEHTGAVAAGWPRATGTAIWAPPAVADLDQDGELDVIVGDQLLSPTPVNQLYAWDRLGAPKPGFPVAGLDAVTCQVRVADVDGDQDLEILFESNVFGQGYQAVSHDGTPVAGWPLPVAGGSFNTELVLADADGNGLLDLAGAGHDPNQGTTQLYLWTTTTPATCDAAPVATHMYGPTRDGVGDRDPCAAPGAPYCFGDGTGAACPCGNTGAPGEGCANGGGAGGRVDAAGSASVSADDLLLGASQLLPLQPALLFAGETALGGGSGVAFGDGLRCAGTNVVRLGTATPDGAGAAAWGPGLAAFAGWSAGDVRFLQVWYRDPQSSPCGSGFNLTNGLEVQLAP